MKIIWYMIPEIWSTTDRTIFCPFKYTKNHDHMLYCFWDMVCDTCNSYFSFWAIFLPFYPPPPLFFPFLTAQKIKISKYKKKTLRYHHFTQVYQKLWLDDMRFLRYGTQQMDTQMDAQTDRQTKKVTYKGGRPT